MAKKDEDVKVTKLPETESTDLSDADRERLAKEEADRRERQEQAAKDAQGR